MYHKQQKTVPKTMKTPVRREPLHITPKASSGVKDSLTWKSSDNDNKVTHGETTTNKTEGGRQTRNLIIKGDLGRPFKRGFELPRNVERDAAVPSYKPVGEGSVREAMLGWPSTNLQQMPPVKEEFLQLIEIAEAEATEMSNVTATSSDNTSATQEKTRRDKGVRNNRAYEIRAQKHWHVKEQCDPRDLWQMPRFKQNAKSSVQSFRNQSG